MARSIYLGNGAPSGAADAAGRNALLLSVTQLLHKG
jgi:hypothetical protein